MVGRDLEARVHGVSQFEGTQAGLLSSDQKWKKSPGSSLLIHRGPWLKKMSHIGDVDANLKVA